MAKFIFKMQNILEIKRKLEDQAKSVYAEAIHALEIERGKLQELEEKKELYEDRLTDMMLESLHIHEICRMENAIEVMKYKIQEQLVAVRKAERVVENARQALHAAMVDRKTYEKLREKEFETFKLEVNAQEKKEIDELVSYQFTQKAKVAEL
ncbi:MAG: flagellar export protein FliJ [Lachnospiraceae bacterium]|nr:flagellar export protein FliJ [Lachnospiraceae bacterium]